MRASPDGRIFGWRPRVGGEPHEMALLVLRPEGATYKHHDIDANLLMPGTDGRTVCCHRGILDLELNAILTSPVKNTSQPFIPAIQGPYFLQLISTEFTSRGKHDGRGTVVVHHSGSKTELARIPSVEGIFGVNMPYGEMKDLITYDRRVLFIPAAKLLINIPGGNDRIVLRRFDVDAELEKSGKDYLLIESEAPLTAVRGEEYRYQIDTKSKKGGVKHQIESAPKDMTVSEAGLVRWKVPADFNGNELKFSVSVSDSGGSERIQSIQVDIVAADVPATK